MKCYEDYGAKESAAMIIRDCVLKGKSTGWSTYNPKVYEEVQAICADYNVKMVCDFNGEWELCKPND